MKNNQEVWIENTKIYCEKYNIPLIYLADILNEPKVVPMIRGKAFEFSAMLRLQDILPKSDWIVDKPVMNAQFGFHDMDVRVTHKKTKAIIGIECKLAAKGAFKLDKNENASIRIKCMRSRTLGEIKANELANKLNLDYQLLKVHNDQYVPSDFDVVITTIANAFYVTNSETDLFDWQPSNAEVDFLKRILQSNEVDKLQYLAYNQMYLAQSKSLSVTVENNVLCSRKTCPIPQSCGFIPNYPTMLFERDKMTVSKPWTEVDNAVDFFLQMIN